MFDAEIPILSAYSHTIFHLQIIFSLKPPFIHDFPNYKPPFNPGFPNFWPRIWGCDQCRSMRLARLAPTRCRNLQRFNFAGLPQSSQCRNHSFLPLLGKCFLPRELYETHSDRRTYPTDKAQRWIQCGLLKWRTSMALSARILDRSTRASTRTFSPQAYRPILDARQTCYASWHLGQVWHFQGGTMEELTSFESHGPHSQTSIGLPLCFSGSWLAWATGSYWRWCEYCTDPTQPQ